MPDQVDRRHSFKSKHDIITGFGREILAVKTTRNFLVEPEVMGSESERR